MKRLMSVLLLLSLGAAAHAETVIERWGNTNECCHRDTLKVRAAGRARHHLIFDLSALPKGVDIQHASLIPEVFERDVGSDMYPKFIHVQPDRPILVYPFEIGPSGRVERGQAPLELEPPWYRSLDATRAVKVALDRKKTELKLAADRFDYLYPEKCVLEIRYSGKPKQPPTPLNGLKVIHHHGQTFISWKEPKYLQPKEILYVKKFAVKYGKQNIDVFAEKAGPGLHPAIRLKELRRLEKVATERPCTVRVFRHHSPITAANLSAAETLADVPCLQGYDDKYIFYHGRGEHSAAVEEPTSPLPVLCPKDETPLAAGENLYVHTVRSTGKAFYAVVPIIAGRGNAIALSTPNSLQQPVTETVGTPRPVLQFSQENAVHPEARMYLFWAAPPYDPLPSRPFHVAVGFPKEKENLFLSVTTVTGIGGLRKIIAVHPRHYHKGIIEVKLEQHMPYCGDLAMSEGFGTLRSFEESRTVTYPQGLYFRIREWAMKSWQADPARVKGGGKFLRLQYPERFAVGPIVVGPHGGVPNLKWCPDGVKTMLPILGPLEMARTADGKPGWDLLDINAYLKQDPSRDLPFFLVQVFGRNRHPHGREYGWAGRPKVLRTLIETKRPFYAAWGTLVGGEHYGQTYRQYNEKKATVAWDRPLPAFGNCTLDSMPGCGIYFHGEENGQLNGYLFWESKDCVDKPNRFEMTVYLLDCAPSDTCRVDFTPRQCKAFKARPGERFTWENVSLADDKPAGSGEVVADQWGLVTLRQILVTKGKNRIKIRKADTADAGLPYLEPSEAHEAAFAKWRDTVNRPVVRLRTVKKAPIIDGKRDDLYGRSSRPLSLAFIDGKSREPREPTTAWVVSDKEHLYAFVRCEKRVPDDVVANQTKRDKAVWRDEVVEFYLDPANTRKRDYFHIIVNARGTLEDIRNTNGKGDGKWNPPIEAKTVREDGGAWSVELKIPLSGFDLKPEAIPAAWSFNITRTARSMSDPGFNEDTAWAPTGTNSPHVPNMFGYLWLDAGRVMPQTRK